MQFQSTTVHRIFLQNAISDSTDFGKRTNALYRDCSAWYNIVMAVDTTDGTIGNRIKLYTNGVQTDWDGTYSADDGPDEDLILNFNVATTGGNQNQHRISNSYNPANFYIAEAVFIDGQQLTPSSFGETDEDSGIWKPKSVSGLTFGDNGWYLEFKNSAVGTGASDTVGADTSGNDNHFTTVAFATTDQTTDSPTNNFAVINLLWRGLSARSAPTLTEGNTTVDHATTDSGAYSTIIPSNGKWYAEFKATEVSSNTSGIAVQNLTDEAASWRADAFQNAKGYMFFMNGATGTNTGSTTSYGSAWSADDIIGIAMDLDNGKLYFAINNTWQDSGDPTSGATGTGAAFSIDAGDLHALGSAYKHSLEGQWNFGNPAGSISSGNADANGYGNFEYAPPSGYYALCTKNLAEFGG